MGNNKKYKNELRCGDKIVNIRTLTDEVNKCDKFFGVKLKKNNIYTEPDKIFLVAVAEAETYVSGLIVALNGIPVDEYFSTSSQYGTVHGPIGVEYDEFTNLSMLRWDQQIKYDTKSLEYKCRFLTIVLSDLLFKIEKIANNKWRKSGKGFGMYEYGYLYVKKIVEDTSRLVIRMIAEEDCSNSLIKMNMNFAYSRHKVNSKAINNKVFEAVTSLRDGFKFSLYNTTDNYLEDDVAIYTIIRLAYMMSTNDYDFSKLPSFKQLEGATSKHDLGVVFEDLGAAILDYHETNKRPVMYKAFNEASPRLWTNYKDVNDDIFLATGMRAVMFVDYMIGNSRLHEFIYDMTHLVKQK